MVFFFFVFVRASSPICTNRRWACFGFFVGFFQVYVVWLRASPLFWRYTNHGASASLFCLLTITYALSCKISSSFLLTKTNWWARLFSFLTSVCCMFNVFASHFLTNTINERVLLFSPCLCLSFSLFLPAFFSLLFIPALFLFETLRQMLCVIRLRLLDAWTTPSFRVWC